MRMAWPTYSKPLWITAILLALSLPASASDCPTVADNTAEKDRLHRELLATKTEMSGRVVGGRLWAIWSTAPNDKAQDMLDRGLARLRQADFDRAEQHFNDLITYCPHYAEGWNQRAYAHFLRHNYDESLDDLAETLVREPRHFGALAGRALVFMNMGRTKLGHKALREALKVNPWLSERGLLPPGNDI